MPAWAGQSETGLPELINFSDFPAGNDRQYDGDAMAVKRVKILYAETYTHVAGGQRGLLDLMSYLDKREFEPVLLLQGPGKLQQEAEKRGIRWIRRRLEPFKNRWLPFSWMLGVGAVQDVLRRERPDVVHSNHLYVGRYSGRAAKRLRIPCLVTLRLVHEPEIYDRYNRWNTLRCHDRIIANSDEGRRVFETDESIRGKISTIKNGMDLQRFRPVPDRAALRRRLGAAYGLDESSLVITQVASMVPQKGNEELTRVFIELVRAHPSIPLHLFFVGGAFARTDNSPAIRAMAREAGIEGRIHLTEYIPDVTEFLNITDISVLCSREREGLPRGIIEAMACGNPVIGTDVGGMRELIQDGSNGFLIRPKDMRELRERLERLILDAGLRRSMGEEGLRIARRDHDIRVMMERYQSVYRELAGTDG
jgi:glycosyltransferase involved in cell wall biosynthesis